MKVAADALSLTVPNFSDVPDVPRLGFRLLSHPATIGTEKGPALRGPFSCLGLVRRTQRDTYGLDKQSLVA